MIFDFIQDLGNYAERKVDRYQDNVLDVSTCRVSDGAKPFETAIRHPKYDSGNWIIVEAYKTAKEAYSGHNRWVKAMLAEKLPRVLTDCCNSEVGQLCGDLGLTRDFESTIDQSQKEE